jgi:phosphatidylserine/phosphatidylglycerophosphate/cardiolipin synthase-like enzyme
MKKIIFPLACMLFAHFILTAGSCKAQGRPAGNGPLISGLTYDSIKQNSLSVFWTTDSPADSKILWMAPDSNYQPLIFTDSVYLASAVTNHMVPVTNLQPAKIYKYRVVSQNAGGSSVDSGYFITQSASTGKVDVYFNHTVDTTVSMGEKANGNQNFSALLVTRIDSARYSIDITLWEFSKETAVSAALINAKDRGVKIRFIYTNNTPDSPLVDTLQAHEIPVLKRNFDTIHSMHNKFWIFDYRYNSIPGRKYLWTGSTNVSHAQFYEDRNNIIVIQDEALCASYTREFEEMWGSHTNNFIKSRAKFGKEKADNVPHILNVAGTRMEVYFTPSDSVPTHDCTLIKTKTTKSLFFCMYKFTLAAFEDTLHAIFNEGRSVNGVFDSTNSKDVNCAYPRMKGKPVANAWNPAADVYIDTVDGLLHHKYFLIDANTTTGNKITVTGSFNWEPDGSYYNDENELIIFDPRVNNLYFQEFYARYRESGGPAIGMQNIYPGSLQNLYLGQNFPNPVDQETSIPYSLNFTGFIRLSIFDSQGREVEILVNKKQEEGKWVVKWDASRFPAGIYCYRLTANNFTETRKMVVLK